jgi:SAM-dependent methyltransferase
VTEGTANSHSNATPSGASKPSAGWLRASGELFAISFLVLFLELACIRWFASTVIFLTFFTNIVLMGCFLGVSVGCLAAGRKVALIQLVVPVAIASAGAACAFLWLYSTSTQVMIDVGSQQSPQLIYFGTDARVKDPSKWVIPMEALAGGFFVFIAMLFVGLGQEMGRRFAAIEDRVAAYTADVLGSLTGIVAFGLLSALWVPAWAWFAIALAGAVAFVPRHRWAHAVGAAAAVGLIALADWPRDAMGVETEVTWSPYYQVLYKPRYRSIDVNHIGHQGMLDVRRSGPAYRLPHRLARDAGAPAFGDVLIIGAGSGNDVAAALAMGAQHVDAVEIDPVINGLGRRDHPDRPFGDPRVTVHLDDGRGFLRRTDRKYDLICYALVDSLTLHSSYSSVRLESFLFTEEALRDVKSHLKPGGVLAMYNFYRQGWVVARLVRLAEAVFGGHPLVFSMPHQDVIAPDDDQRDRITLLLAANGPATIVDTIRAQFDAEGPLWLADQGGYHSREDRPGPGGPGSPLKIAPTRVELAGTGPLPTDDWPFLYLRDAMIPALSLRGIAVVAAVSAAILLAFAPVRRARPDGRMFFLGAGFMLLETKGVVHMALLFGATWLVNSIVFFAILCMILLANLYVAIARPARLAPYYLMLLAALVVDAAVPMGVFLGLPGPGRIVASCAVVYLPVFFAGVIFATAFRSSARPDVDFGSNIGGIILGGVSEYLSLVVGFRHLLWIAVGYYALSWALGGRGCRPDEGPGRSDREEAWT